MDFLLLIAISVSLAFILVYCKKNFFVKKAFYAAPNTSRGFALLADFIVFNSINFVYILVKVFTVPAYKPEFQAFAEYVFHNGGDGMGMWFLKTQAMLMLIYIPYSLITELSPINSTLSGRFFGLSIEVEEGKNRIASIFIRNMIKPICIVFFPVFMLLSYFNEDRQWLHDKVSNCKINREK